MFRKEVYLSNSLEQTNKIMKLLRQNNIECWSESQNSSIGIGSFRRMQGLQGQQHIVYNHYVYVNRKDYKLAKSLIYTSRN